MAEQYDIVVIGGGPGGYVAALRASQLGAQVALVEEDALGGVCLNVGCIPTKALLRSAEILETMHDAKQYGIKVRGEIEPDWAAMQKRKEQITGRLTKGVGLLLKKSKVAVLNGRGRLAGANVVEVTGTEGVQQIRANKVIVATGSRPIVLPLPGFDLPDVLDSTGALALENLPDRMLIVGGGVIGAEFATLFATLGVEVTIVEMLDRMLPMLDAEIGQQVFKSLKRRKVEMHFDSKASRIVQRGDALVVTVETAEGEQSFEVDKVLVSVGRRANTEDLGLETAGVETKRNGIAVNKRMETNVPGIYAVGDVTGAWWLAHVSSAEGVVAAENACGHPAKMDYKTVPSCVFTHPEVSSVGLTEEQAREQGYDVLVGRFPMMVNGKALTYGERDGWVKVVSEAKYGEVLGVHIVGAHASDLILEGGLALGMEATLDEIEGVIHAHPTLGEAIAEAALAARGLALHV
jgi:dihydrolipoamide dehydrogenase